MTTYSPLATVLASQAASHCQHYLRLQNLQTSLSFSLPMEQVPKLVAINCVTCLCGKPGQKMRSQWKVSHGDPPIKAHSLHQHMGMSPHQASQNLKPLEAQHGDSQVHTVTKDFTFSQFPFALKTISPFCTFFLLLLKSGSIHFSPELPPTVHSWGGWGSKVKIESGEGEKLFVSLPLGRLYL